MPVPGSRKHDVALSNERSRLEDRGTPDERAEAEAHERVAADERFAEATASGRAAGPRGERGGGGDPGDVIVLRSPAFSDNTMIPERHTRAGDNVPPALEWGDVPDGTAELALVCEDLDAPEGTATHWLLTGIDPQTRSIGGGGDGAEVGTALPNAFGHRGYDGPAPPIGDEPHRYVFRLFALDDPLPSETRRADAPTVRDVLDERRTASGTLIGTFAR